MDDETTRATCSNGRAASPGALTRDEFEQGLRDAGFGSIEIVETHRVHDQAGSAIVRAELPR